MEANSGPRPASAWLRKSSPVGLDSFIRRSRHTRSRACSDEMRKVSHTLGGREAIQPGCLLSNVPVTMILADKLGQIQFQAVMGTKGRGVKQSFVGDFTFLVCNGKEKRVICGTECISPRCWRIMLCHHPKIEQNPAILNQTERSIPTQLDVVCIGESLQGLAQKGWVGKYDDCI